MTGTHSQGAPSARTDEVVDRLTALDYAIFERLPDEGRMLGWTPMVISVPLLRDKLNEALPNGSPKITSSALQARLRPLRLYGFAVRVVGLSGGTQGWQRTEHAARLLAARKAPEQQADNDAGEQE